jgi:hypothetical protein
MARAVKLSGLAVLGRSVPYNQHLCTALTTVRS